MSGIRDLSRSWDKMAVRFVNEDPSPVSACDVPGDPSINLAPKIENKHQLNHRKKQGFEIMTRILFFHDKYKLIFFPSYIWDLFHISHFRCKYNFVIRWAYNGFVVSVTSEALYQSSRHKSGVHETATYHARGSCFVLYCVYFLYHVIQDYFTGATVRLPQCQQRHPGGK